MSGEAELSFWLKRQLSAFEEKFDVADKDKNGSLSYPEISEVLRNAGFKGAEADLQVWLILIGNDELKGEKIWIGVYEF